MMWVGDYGSLFEKGCVLSYCKSLIGVVNIRYSKNKYWIAWRGEVQFGSNSILTWISNSDIEWDGLKNLKIVCPLIVLQEQ